MVTYAVMLTRSGADSVQTIKSKPVPTHGKKVLRLQLSDKYERAVETFL